MRRHVQTERDFTHMYTYLCGVVVDIFLEVLGH